LQILDHLFSLCHGLTKYLVEPHPATDVIDHFLRILIPDISLTGTVIRELTIGQPDPIGTLIKHTFQYGPDSAGLILAYAI
jgi:hypothetical protein